MNKNKYSKTFKYKKYRNYLKKIHYIRDYMREYWKIPENRKKHNEISRNYYYAHREEIQQKNLERYYKNKI